MREPEERTTIINTGGGSGGAGMIAGVLAVVAVVALLIYLFVDIGGGENTPTATIDVPNVTVESPDIDVTVPQAPSGSEGAPATTAPAAD